MKTVVSNTSRGSENAGLEALAGESWHTAKEWGVSTG